MKRYLLVLLTMSLFGSMALAQVQDEEISQSKDWMAEKVAMDPAWQRPSCVASTMGDDEMSTLEVIAFYNPSTMEFGEPMVHVITPFDVSFFEVSVHTSSSSSGRFAMLPVTLPKSNIEGVDYVGVRAFFDDREDLVKALRNRNRVVAKYFDLQGEVKSVKFSLRGSNATIKSMFKSCSLEFGPDLKGMEELPTLD